MLLVVMSDAAVTTSHGMYCNVHVAAVGTVHAVLGAMLFAAVAAICLLTSWQGAPELVRDYGWPSLRFLSRAVAFLVAVQVWFGAGFRHSAVGVLPHLLRALLVAFMGISVAHVATGSLVFAASVMLAMEP